MMPGLTKGQTVMTTRAKCWYAISVALSELKIKNPKGGFLTKDTVTVEHIPGLSEFALSEDGKAVFKELADTEGNHLPCPDADAIRAALGVKAREL
jgi:hypothetical protein